MVLCTCQRARTSFLTPRSCFFHNFLKTYAASEKVKWFKNRCFRCDRIFRLQNTIDAKIPNWKLLETTGNLWEPAPSRHLNLNKFRRVHSVHTCNEGKLARVCAFGALSEMDMGLGWISLRRAHHTIMMSKVEATKRQQKPARSLTL